MSVIGAGLIHLAAVRSHIGSPAAVASFVGTGLVQILLGASFLFSGAARLKRFVLLGVGGLATGAWLVSDLSRLPSRLRRPRHQRTRTTWMRRARPRTRTDLELFQSN